MNFQPLTIDELTHIGKTLYGSRWKTPLAQAIKVPRERVSRWCSTRNRQDIPEALIPVIRALYHQGDSYYKERRFNAKGRIKQIGNALLIHADSRKLLDLLPSKVDVILTDPVWPKPLPDLAGSHNPYQLLHDVLRLVPKVLTDKGRIIIHMRRDSDPRILLAVPPAFKFIGSAVLPYAVPSRRGRMLNSYDIAYIFGKPPASRPGNRVLPGQIPLDFCPAARPIEKITNHPCPRHLAHVEWLVEKFSEPTDTILDPFMGGGTTGVAALNRGRHFVGIEIERKYWLEVQEVLMSECNLTDSNSLDNEN